MTKLLDTRRALLHAYMDLRDQALDSHRYQDARDWQSFILQHIAAYGE